MAPAHARRARRQVDRLLRDPNLAPAVALAERLDRRWFFTRLRARIPDGDRETVKQLRTMRGVRLFLFWRRGR